MKKKRFDSEEERRDYLLHQAICALESAIYCAERSEAARLGGVVRDLDEAWVGMTYAMEILGDLKEELEKKGSTK